MDHHAQLVLPTPPRSPASSPIKKIIKSELIISDDEEFPLNNYEDDVMEFEDIFQNIMEEENFNTQGIERKRKLSELLSVGDMDAFLRDLTSDLLLPSSSSTTTHPQQPPPPPPSSPITLPNLDNNPANSLLDSLLSSLSPPSYYGCTTPPPTRAPSPALSSSSLENFLFSSSPTIYDDLLPPTIKRKKFDSFSSNNSNILNDDCFLFNNHEEEKTNNNLSNYSLEHMKAAFTNDHNYCANNNSEEKEEEDSSVVIDGVEIVDKEFFNFDNIPKKTKILVPLKSLMRTLQQKSFLVSPLGPGKKVIRLTGNGESVKGVLQSTSLLSSSSSQSSSSTSPSSTSTPSSSNQKPPQMHNVRKRPHSNLLLTSKQSDELTNQNLDLSSPSSSLCSNFQTTKKKTKAHNNMERMRRIDLRNSFDNLKKLVPVLSKSPKCSKVEILRRAEEYVRGLRQIEKKLVKEENILRVRMQELKSRLE